MYPIEVSHIAKSFGSTRAVADVSFNVERGEIFGLLGPNGAGKTTTIRIMLDIFRPDRIASAICPKSAVFTRIFPLNAVWST
jgi:ABC-2 type transport system ATP-binding protein